MKALTQIFHILFIIVFLPVEIFISVFQTVHIAIRTIVLLSEGKTLDDVQRLAIRDQLEKIHKNLEE